MSLQVRSVKELIKPAEFKLKILIYAPSGYGKTVFASTAPRACIAACELGHGAGALSIANTQADWPRFVEPQTYQELEQFASGNICPEAETLVIDGLSYAADSIIKDYALTVPRNQGNTPSRNMGILELSDYQTLAELERRVLARLLMQNKHVVVTCWQGNYQPPDRDKPEKFGGPDLSGSMRTGASALFDVVLRLQIRPQLRNPKDATSRYFERYWQTSGDGKYLAKSRLQNGSKPIFPDEVLFDLEKGTGTFQYFLDKALEAYGKKA